MRCYYFFLFCVFGYGVFIKGQDQDIHFSMHSVQKVEQRYYLIKRLEPAIDTLFAVHNALASSFWWSRPNKPLLNRTNLRHFRHASVIESVEAMATSSDIAPFKKIWHKVLAYRYLEDGTFVREVIILILLLYKNLLLSVDKELYHRKAPDESALTELLIAGHQKLSDLCPHVHCDDISDMVVAVERLLDETSLPTDVVVNNILRFYHVQRLVRSIFILDKHSKRSMPTLVISVPQDTWTHPLVKECVRSLNQKTTLTPLFRLWKKVTSYDCIDDQRLLQEFVRLVILVYNHCMHERALPNRSSENPQEAMVSLYEQIAKLPIPELLDLLDELVDQYEKLSTTYEINNTTMSWSAWAKKYWWAPPVILASLVMVIKDSKFFAHFAYP
ncbi:MAG TPA: hypothetical protein VLG71_00405 [Candidatus Limnocylindria bacterium]|nr:hypothetical protein [Candidatus Limnocylindria bacterium]